jgi:hypothetical protein
MGEGINKDVFLVLFFNVSGEERSSTRCVDVSNSISEIGASFHDPCCTSLQLIHRRKHDFLARFTRAMPINEIQNNGFSDKWP